MNMFGIWFLNVTFGSGLGHDFKLVVEETSPNLVQLLITSIRNLRPYQSYQRGIIMFLTNHTIMYLLLLFNKNMRILTA